MQAKRMNSRAQARGEGRRGEVNGESSTEAKTPPRVKQPVGICSMNQGKETHDL